MFIFPIFYILREVCFETNDKIVFYVVNQLVTNSEVFLTFAKKIVTIQIQKHQVHSSLFKKKDSIMNISCLTGKTMMPTKLTKLPNQTDNYIKQFTQI